MLGAQIRRTTLSMLLYDTLCQQGQCICFLSSLPLFPSATTEVCLGPTRLSSLLFTNTVSPVVGLPIHMMGEVSWDNKKTIVGLLVFKTFSARCSHKPLAPSPAPPPPKKVESTRLRRDLPFSLILWACICKRLRSPGIDSKESIPPAYLAWLAGKSNRVVILIPARQAGNRFLGSSKGLQIRTLLRKYKII
jgi:hypothetical protein